MYFRTGLSVKDEDLRRLMSPHLTGKHCSIQGVEESSSSKLLGSVEGAEEELEEEEGMDEEPVPPTPVLLPIFAQLSARTCPLRRVNLSQSPLSTACVQALASCLPTSPLEVLTLDECALTVPAPQLLE